MWKLQLKPSACIRQQGQDAGTVEVTRVGGPTNFGDAFSNAELIHPKFNRLSHTVIMSASSRRCVQLFPLDIILAGSLPSSVAVRLFAK